MFIPNFMNFCIFKTELKVKRGLGDQVFIKFKVESDPWTLILTILKSF